MIAEGEDGAYQGITEYGNVIGLALVGAGTGFVFSFFTLSKDHFFENPTQYQIVKGAVEGLVIGALVGFFIEEFIIAGLISIALNVSYDAFIVPRLPFDPPLPPLTTGLNIPFPDKTRATASVEMDLQAAETAGQVAGSIQAVRLLLQAI